jgi:hypothetical protein
LATYKQASILTHISNPSLFDEKLASETMLVPEEDRPAQGSRAQALRI